MIEARFKGKDEKFEQIFVTGHANYKPHGEDIVCAAISTATIMTANMIEHLGLQDYILVTMKDGYFKLDVLKEAHLINQVLSNLKYTIIELEKQYPKYIKTIKEG
ncbi:MAG: ribosomal-processing cysteine protease Prp [Tenericutes bacterium HGW-Tenericutes-6]|jgi:hypothetical protein|nr:MAG: ribosomal-processing cysteine protease Prp [Tenericutes bacterium HGW-Tenericutes-6]